MHPDLDALFDLTGQTVLVTNSAAGVGRGVARALGLAGARLMLSGPDADALEEAMQDLQDEGIDTRWTAANSAVEADMQRLGELTLARMGDVDVLVHAIDVRGLDEDALQDQLLGAEVLSRCLAEQSMLECRAGRIVLLLVGAAGGETVVSTGDVRAAAEGFVRSLHEGWSALGVRVNALCLADVGRNMPALLSTVLLWAGAGGGGWAGQCMVLHGDD